MDLNKITRQIRLKFFVSGYFVFPGAATMADVMLIGQVELYKLCDKIYFELL